MQTKIGGRESLKEAVRLIKNDELVAIPTETVYGLGANAMSEAAVAKIFAVKGRPQDNPLIVHISDIGMLPLVAEDISSEVANLFKEFSPGPLTLILKKNKNLAKSVSPDLDTVGVRIPNHEIALELIKAAGVPIAAPSANTSSRVSPTTAAHVLEDLNGKISLILDGGECGVGIESTILDMTKDIPVILRPGRIKPKDLLRLLPKIKIKNGDVKVAEAPGMKYKHYAPRVMCVLARNLQSALYEYDNVAISGKPVIIGSKEYVAKCGCREIISLGSDFDEIEKNYFLSLREAEKKYDYIIIQFFKKDEGWAIMNRIFKSCNRRIVSH